MKTLVGCLLMAIGIACVALLSVVLRKPKAQWTDRDHHREGALRWVGLVATIGGANLLNANG